MATYREYIKVKTEKRVDFINITKKIQEIVGKSEVVDGLVLINPMHITASVFVNDAESGLLKDFEKWLKNLAPVNENYEHNKTGEDNAYAHLWRTLMGREAVVAVSEGKLDLGTWEQIFYGEFDGKRKKRVLIKIIGE